MYLNEPYRPAAEYKIRTNLVNGTFDIANIRFVPLHYNVYIIKLMMIVMS